MKELLKKNLEFFFNFQEKILMFSEFASAKKIFATAKLFFAKAYGAIRPFALDDKREMKRLTVKG